MSYVFLFRLKDSDDRDCCAYIENKFPRFECDHYFGEIILHGSCYNKLDFPKYEKIETVLAKEEYEALVAYNKAISKLGYGIKKGDERYNKGIELSNDIKYVFDKLNDQEAKDFFEKIVESEMEYLMKEYELDEEDIETIFDKYVLECGNYRDRSVVAYVWNDIGEYAYEEAFELGYVTGNCHTRNDRYFDYDKFADDLLEREDVVELKDGRIALLSY